MRKISKVFPLSLVCIILLLLLFNLTLFIGQVQAQYYYYSSCGTACVTQADCDVGLFCPSGICGLYYDVCNGPTCMNNWGWDATTCSTPNQCSPSGSTRTAYWDIGTCSASCGSGTRTDTCVCGSQNACPVSCTSPFGSCGNTIYPTCCTSQNPQTEP
jgi:hypothetical protein